MSRARYTLCVQYRLASFRGRRVACEGGGKVATPEYLCTPRKHGRKSGEVSVRALSCCAVQSDPIVLQDIVT